jgi:DoxX-like protein
MKGHVMKIGRLLIRLVVGGLFIGHGSQKLFGWFGGPGPDGTEQMMYKIDMHPARRQAFAAGLTETSGGALLAAGLATSPRPAPVPRLRALGIELGRTRVAQDAASEPDPEAVDEAASRGEFAAEASR